MRSRKSCVCHTCDPLPPPSISSPSLSIVAAPHCKCGPLFSSSCRMLPLQPFYFHVFAWLPRGWVGHLCWPATLCKFPNAFRSNECKVPNHASHCERQLSGVCLCYGSASTYSTTVCLACGTRLTCRRTLRGRTCGPAGETTTGETMLMKA